MEEKIIIKAKRLKQLNRLSSQLGDLGFSKISYTKERLTLERITGEDLKGKPNLDYRIILLENSIEFIYDVSPKQSKRARLLELLPVFLNVLVISEDYYEMKPSAIFSHILNLLSDLSKVVGRDVMELSSELEDLKLRHESLNSKYKDLVGSSEENARILLECERRRDELMNIVKKLRAMSDERLKEELYSWLKMHNGSIDLNEFGRAHEISPNRAEEGLDLLIREGFIKRRVE
jgi:hypothetical protein